MRARRTLGGFPLVGAAFGGVVLGHSVSYVLAVPQARLRDVVLAATGHGYWDSAVRSAVALVVIALAVVALRQVRSARAREPLQVERPGRTAARLAALQVLGFIAMEVTERAAAGAPLSGIVQHHVLLIGVLVQVAVAVVVAVALFAFARTVGEIARALIVPRFAHPPRRTFFIFLTPGSKPAFLSAASGPRAPPAR